MNNLYAVDISRSQFVKSDDIFGIVIFYFKEIYKLPVRFFRKIAADLHINPLVAPYRKQNLFARACKSHTEIDCGCRFTDSAFLICDGITLQFSMWYPPFRLFIANCYVLLPQNAQHYRCVWLNAVFVLDTPA